MKVWHYIVGFLFLWLFLADFVRKLFPQLGPEVVLVIDFILLFAYLAFLVQSKIKKWWNPPFLFELLLFLSVLIVHIFWVTTSPEITLLGLRSYLWFIPLAWLGYHSFSRKEQLFKFSKVLVSFSIPLLFFAILETVGVGSSVLGVFKGGHGFHSFAGSDVFKASSLFGSAQRFGMVSLFLFLSGLGIFSYFKKSKYKTLIASAILASFINIILSASRSTFILAVITGLAWIIFYYGKPILLRLKRDLALSFFLITAGVFSLFAISWLMAEMNYGNILFQFKSIGRLATEKIPSLVRKMQFAIRETSFFGRGVGTMSSGLQYLEEGEKYKKETMRIGAGETGIWKLLFELGWLGFVGFYFLWGKILDTMGRAWKKIKNFHLRSLGLVFILFIAAVLIRFLFVHHQTFGDYAVLIPLWFSMGVFYKLPSIKK